MFLFTFLSPCCEICVNCDIKWLFKCEIERELTNNLVSSALLQPKMDQIIQRLFGDLSLLPPHFLHWNALKWLCCLCFWRHIMDFCILKSIKASLFPYCTVYLHRIFWFFLQRSECHERPDNQSTPLSCISAKVNGKHLEVVAIKNPPTIQRCNF